MRPEMLQVQQYIQIHPVRKESYKTRIKYIVFLSYMKEMIGEIDQWSEGVISLYTDKLVSDDEREKGSKLLSKINSISQCKVFKYRYFLLTDCLFAYCFEDGEKAQNIVELFVGVYGERFRKKFQTLCNAFYSEGSDIVKKQFRNLSEIYSVIWGNRAFKNSPLKRIMITANMSAGKSTLLNALAGKKVNKTQNDTCTAKLHYLYNKAGEDGFSYELDHDLELDASLDILMTDNDENDSTDIVVGTRFRSINDIDDHICFIDTPGVNSSMDKEHRKIANHAISSEQCDVLIYLFNAENIGTDDDKDHLRYVKENYKGRILFLVNRLDNFKAHESVGDTVKSEKDDLVAMGFENPEVYPISAYAAYLGKMILKGEILSYEEDEELHDLMRKLKKDSFCYDKYYPVEINANASNSIDELLLHSGILSLESLLYSV